MTTNERPRVLLVDDDTAVRRSFARALSRTHDVTEAPGGAAAIEILGERARLFDVVVTDLSMPGVGGDALVSWLEEHDPALAARVVVVTGGPATPEQATWLEAYGEARVLRKPCSHEDLVTAIERAMQRGA